MTISPNIISPTVVCFGMRLGDKGNKKKSKINARAMLGIHQSLHYFYISPTSNGGIHNMQIDVYLEAFLLTQMQKTKTYN